ncbi:D-alanyl-D-alanine carboxypeptidase family protein [Rhizobium sp. GN54]|uniref:D-alanyl-D-alanine carboxypeptidase family protein n=1 Tax=Rhizobium sp. GN54 TaxID=2898150 RepID=UPI001E31B841|nr:D-alanyl-D-alanine carboxypeptidase family protein [Rhizobium sp. GN54]MCD2185218.1 D-alanyl-D-alanine carboxypeptidase family protein [Rhizobium sp. GN54]
MSTEQERLVVSLEARIRDFERNFQKANRTTGQNFDAIERRAKQSGDRLEASMSKASQGVNVGLAAMKGGIAGLAAGLSVGTLTGIVSRVGELAKGVASIGDEARRAGLSVKAFQEFKHVAEQNRIGVDALTDGFKELSLRADEFIVTGKGSAAEAFQRLGFTAQDLKRKLQDPSALFTEIIGKLGQLDKAAQIRIADELFGGTGGEQFVQLIQQGEASLRATVQQAHDLGLVLSEDVIQKADEIDKKFNLLSRTIGTKVKGAVVEVASELLTWGKSIDQWNEATNRRTMVQLANKLEEIAEAREALDQIAIDKALSPDDPTTGMNWDRQTELLRELEREAQALRAILYPLNGKAKDDIITGAGDSAKEAKAPLSSLNEALEQTGSAASTGVNGIKSYSDAIRSLANEVPELAKSLAELDAKTRIHAVYKAAVGKARTMGEVYQANEMRGKALQSLGIKSATDDPAAYLSNVLASGKSASHVTGLSSDFAGKLAKMLASMPADLRGQVTVNSGYRSPERQQELWLQALQKYGSPEAARKWVAPPGRSQHNSGNAVDLGYGSDAAKQWMHQNAASFGLSFPLANEDWHLEPAGARDEQRAEEIQRQTEALTSQADAYRQIITDGQQYIQTQTTEQQALGLTAQQAAKLRYEQDLLNQAQRAGITVTPQQRQEIETLATGMAQAEAATMSYAQTQEEAQQASHFFASSAADALTGVIMGTTSAQDALKGLIASLAKAALQAALLGEGPLAGLMGGGTGAKTGGGGGGIFGAIFGALFGAKDGGYIQAFAGGGKVHGPGGSRDDKVPAWLSDGEFVVNAAATKRNRAALEAINAGRTPVLSAKIGGKGGAVSQSTHVVNTFSPTIPITVQASGNKETDAAMVERLSKELDTVIQNKMTDFVSDQQRPGNMLNRGGFV